MNYYISDTHFGHSNAIKFDNRPFKDRDEMDRVMIELWNSRVRDEDHVYIIGDFCYRAEKTPATYLKQLNGHKHLVVGNHDRNTIENEQAKKYFDSIELMMHIVDEGEHICLCHFPIADWNRARHGSWHIYGHIHGSKDDAYQFMKTRPHALNAAACINHYMPATFKELIKNNQAFQELDNM